MNISRQLANQRLKELSECIHALYQPHPEKDFARRSVAALDTFFGSDIVCYNEFPAGRSELIAVSNVDFDPSGKYTPLFLQLVHEHPQYRDLFITQYIPGQRLTDAMPVERYKRTQLYNEFYRKVAADYQMATVFPGDNGNIIGLVLNQQRRDFTDQELFEFQLIFPHLRQAYDQHQAAQRGERAVHALETVVRSRNLGIAILDTRDRVREVYAPAREFAQSAFNCHLAEGRLLPEPLREPVKRWRVAARAVPPVPQAPLERESADGAVIRLRLAETVDPSRHLLVFERKRGIPAASDLVPLGLTRREAEVVHWMMREKTNWEIARILGNSERTVEKHVEKVFAKLGINDRRQLGARVEELRPDATG